MTQPEPTTPTFGEMFEEILDLVTGLGVLLLPALILAVPGLVLLLPLLILPLPLLLLAAPFLLVRWLRGRLRAPRPAPAGRPAFAE